MHGWLFVWMFERKVANECKVNSIGIVYILSGDSFISNKEWWTNIETISMKIHLYLKAHSPFAHSPLWNQQWNFIFEKNLNLESKMWKTMIYCV